MREAGFTLLEVLIALAILSAVALVAIQGVGDGLVSIGDSGWQDRAARLGRGQMIHLLRQGMKGGSQGTFAPDFPEISWKATVSDIGEMEGRRLEMVISQEPGNHKLILEKIIVP